MILKKILGARGARAHKAPLESASATTGAVRLRSSHETWVNSLFIQFTEWEFPQWDLPKLTRLPWADNNCSSWSDVGWMGETTVKSAQTSSARRAENIPSGWHKQFPIWGTTMISLGINGTKLGGCPQGWILLTSLNAKWSPMCKPEMAKPNRTVFFPWNLKYISCYFGREHTE